MHRFFASRLHQCPRFSIPVSSAGLPHGPLPASFHARDSAGDPHGARSIRPICGLRQRAPYARPPPSFIYPLHSVAALSATLPMPRYYEARGIPGANANIMSDIQHTGCWTSPARVGRPSGPSAPHRDSYGRLDIQTDLSVQIA